MADTMKPIPTIAAARARRAMEEAPLPAGLPSASQPHRTADAVATSRAAQQREPIPPDYVETTADAIFDEEEETPIQAAAARDYVRDNPHEAPTTTRPTPEPPARLTKPAITLATTIAHRGRQITITATDMTADQFCDLLDKRGFAPPSALPSAAPLATPDDLPDGWKLCQKHGAPMRPRNKQNDVWNSHNVGTKDVPIWCKGYRGSDSPGYDL